MALTWALASVVVLGLLGLMLWVQYQRSAEDVWETWRTALEPEQLEPYEGLEQRLADSREMLADTLVLARHRAQERDAAEAQRVLVCAAEHVSRHVPDVTVRLAMWHAIGRAAAALRPLPTLGVLQFRDWRLRGTALLERVSRWTLDAGHRFGLRVWVLVRGLGLVMREFTRAATRDTKRGDAPDAPTLDEVDDRLQRMEGLGEDLASLHHASLDTYKTLLDSIGSRPR